MSGKLEGKVAIVTGASKGIGAEIARAMAAEGAAVAVNYATSREAAERVAGEILAAGGRALAVCADMADETAIVRMFDQTVNAFGAVDILVNNAGVYEFLPLEALTAEHFHRHFNVNVLGLLVASREAARHFGDRGGSIVNVSSAVTTLAPPTASVYSASKGAVDIATRCLAKELGPRGIRVNAVNPGMVETEGVHAAGFAEGDFRKMVEAQTPLGRIGQPGDVAPAVVFLASDDAAWITGETMIIAGGMR